MAGTACLDPRASKGFYIILKVTSESKNWLFVKYVRERMRPGWQSAWIRNTSQRTKVPTPFSPSTDRLASNKEIRCTKQTGKTDSPNSAHSGANLEQGNVQVMKTNQPCTHTGTGPPPANQTSCSFWPLDIQDACVEMEGFSTFSSCYQTSLGPLSPHAFAMQSLCTGTDRLLDQRSLESVGHPAQDHFKSPTAILCPGFSLGLGLLTGSSASGCLGQSVLRLCSWASQLPSITLRQLELPLQGFWNGSRLLSAASGLRMLPGYPA